MKNFAVAGIILLFSSLGFAQNPVLEAYTPVTQIDSSQLPYLLNMSINLGSVSQPVDSVLGVAFDLYFDVECTDTTVLNASAATYPAIWGTYGTNYTYIEDFTNMSAGKISFGITRYGTTGINFNGNTILTVQFKVNNGCYGGWFRVTPNILSCNDGFGNAIALSPQADSVQVIKSRCSIAFINSITAVGCPGLNNGAVTVTAIQGTSPYHYAWSNGNTTQAISGLSSGAYYLTVNDAAGCSKSDTIIIQPATPLNDTITLSGPASFCTGGSVTLTAAPGYTYNWSNNSTNQSITASATGAYNVTVFNGNNCSAVSSQVQVTVSPPPSATIDTSGPTTFCQGKSVTLSAQSGNSYHWSNGSSSADIIVTTAGNYAVTVTNGSNCSATSAQIPVNVYSNPSAIITAEGATTFCAGDSVALSAPAGLSYLWSNNETSQKIDVFTTGNYMVQVTNANNCSALSAAQTVTVEPATVITTSPLAQVTCNGGSVTFSVNAIGTGLNYQWQFDGNNIAEANSTSYNLPNANASDTGTYQVVVSGTCGNKISSPALLSLTSSLQISQQPQSQVVCVGSPVSFTFIANGGNATYQWKKGPVNIQGATLSTYNIDSATLGDAANYSCAVTSFCGDTTSLVVSLTVNNPSSYSYAQTICSGSNYYFNGNFLTTGGTYSETLTNVNGCDSIVNLHLTVTPPVVHSINAVFCPNGSYNFEGTELNAPGIFYDTLSTFNGCDSVIELTLAYAHDSGSVQAAICQGEVYAFNGHNYTSAGNYSETLTSSLGCDSVVILALTINNLPDVTLNLNPDTACRNGNIITLTGGSPSGGVYTGPGVIESQFDPASANIGSNAIVYSYTSGNDGCSDSASGAILVEVCAGINSLADDLLISLSPNPASTYLSVACEDISTELRYTVSDVTGLPILSGEINDPKTVINTSGLNSGMYILRLYNSTKDHVVKFIVVQN